MCDDAAVSRSQHLGLKEREMRVVIKKSNPGSGLALIKGSVGACMKPCSQDRIGCRGCRNVACQAHSSAPELGCSSRGFRSYGGAQSRGPRRPLQQCPAVNDVVLSAGPWQGGQR